jgi:hypothetical protein
MLDACTEKIPEPEGFSILPYHCIDPDAVTVHIVWGRRNQYSLPVIKSTNFPLAEGSTIYSRTLFGNGRIDKFEGWDGQYVQHQVIFNNRSRIVVRKIAIPSKFVRMGWMSRLRGWVERILHPFSGYQECEV